MIRRSIIVAALAAATAACGGQPSSTPGATPRDPAERLESILATDITHHQDSLYTAFAAEHGGRIGVLLTNLALDPEAPGLARANAVLRMGARLMLSWDVYSRTVEDPDPRVRGATLAVAGPLATRAPPDALPILARGLVDSIVGVQAKALQELRDRDLELLRWYIEGDPAPELREIALQTLRNAYAWGAPLTPEPDGTLRRIAPGGTELVLRPRETWPQWDALAGTLEATPPGGTARVIADSVEAVASVIPAVVDASGRYVALETARRIEVHDLETGAVRLLGPGIAPRPMPFTPDFLYFREHARARLASGTQLRYEAMRAAFEGGEPAVFDTVVVTAQQDLRGGLSPLRWVRIHDRGTRFVLQTDGLHNHLLPSPSELYLQQADSAR